MTSRRPTLRQRRSPTTQTNANSPLIQVKSVWGNVVAGKAVRRPTLSGWAGGLGWGLLLLGGAEGEAAVDDEFGAGSETCSA